MLHIEAINKEIEGAHCLVSDWSLVIKSCKVDYISDLYQNVVMVKVAMHSIELHHPLKMYTG